MDQLIKVVWHLSLEGIHHEVHPLLHHLHLCNHCSDAVFAMNGQLVSCCSCLFRALLPSGPSRSLLSTVYSGLVPFCSFPWLLGPVFLWRSYSSRSWFCLVRRSTTVTRVYTCLSRLVVRSSSPWLLLVAIERVSTIQLLIWEVVIWPLSFYPTNGANWCRASSIGDTIDAIT